LHIKTKLGVMSNLFSHNSVVSYLHSNKSLTANNFNIKT
jgi:hypothetical protein